MMIYSFVYSTSIDWAMNIVGIADMGGAGSVTFVKDGVTLSTNAHSTWACKLHVPMAPQ